MLRLTEISLQFPEGIKVRADMGSIFHGVLMELTSPAAAQHFHEMSLRPYSQYLYWDKTRQQAIWHIGTLDDYAYEQLVIPLLDEKSIWLKQKQMEIKLLSAQEIQKCSYAELVRKFIQVEAAPTDITWQCLSTMSFKQSQRYVILPDIQLLYQSLLNRWNTFSPEMKLEAPDLLEKLAAHCTLRQYRLESRIFSVEASRIYGCMGMLHYRLFGYDMLKRLQGILAAFAEFSGVGVKTALGMGAVRTIIERKTVK